MRFLVLHIQSVAHQVKSVLVVAVLIVMTGCAYHPGRGERQIPGGYRTVAVPVFKNMTHESGVEVYFTNAFIREMQRARIGSLTDKSAAQVTVDGSIDQIEFNGTTIGQNGMPEGAVLNANYTIVVTSTVRVRRNSDQQTLWQGTFTSNRSYRTPKIGYGPLTGANALYNHSAHYQNIEIMAADLMAEAHDRMTENF
jgi:hypothetical protein